MADQFITIPTELPRDKYGRPLIVPPGGGDPVAYQRVTTFVGPLEDTHNLTLWKVRNAVLGTARRDDIRLAALSITDPKDRYQKRDLNKLGERAIDAGNDKNAATIGTALHSMTEAIDKGEEIPYVPQEYANDLEAYRQITRPFRFTDIEGFVVNDDLRVGGSYDRTFESAQPDWFLTAPDGEHVHAGIWDLKTGGSLDGGLFGIGKIAMQLGTYRNGVLYDHSIGSRKPLPENLSRKWGIVCHLPAGTGTARLLWVDIEAGWNAARELAPKVHAWRKLDKSGALSRIFQEVTAQPRDYTLVEQIAMAGSVLELKRIYKANESVWTEGLNERAKARRKELETF
jgi:hypothetical protein